MVLPSLPPRDCQGWRDDGIRLSSTSNEAAKLLDHGLLQYTAWYEDPAIGGLEGTMEKMMQSDPGFIMGRVLQLGLELMGTGHSPRLDPEFYAAIKDLRTDAAERGTPAEQLHADAVVQWADGNPHAAAEQWEKQLDQCPKDLLALKFLHDLYFFTGQAAKIRDSVANVLPKWDRTSPLYGYMQGMLAFGLEEMNDYAGAQRSAEAALERNRHDGWATHARAHCFEMLGQQDAGIEFMTRTEDNWSVCGILACHNFWHLALYHLEKGNKQEVLDLYDSHVATGAKPGAGMLDVVDAASLLQRMQFEGIDVGSRWEDVAATCLPHAGDHLLCFNDGHIVMSLVGAGKREDADTMIKSQIEYARLYPDCENAKAFQKYGIPLCRGMNAYSSGDYDECVGLMAPIRKKIFHIGGSHAQRDVFNQYILHACVNSANDENHKLAKTLLAERKAQKPNSGITDRLLTKLLMKHDN